MSESFKQYLNTTSEQVVAALQQAFPKQWDIPSIHEQSMMYSLEAGGKRLRPVLVLSASEAVACDVTTHAKAMPVACAIEMIHTYSLIHDDLPAMDNDDLRRGRPTNHKVYGDALAILAGDGLLTHAFYVVTTATQLGVDPLTVVQICADLSKYAGPAGMVGGQVADILGEQGITSIEELEYIHLHKTSDLIVFSVTAGARIGGASAEQLEQLAAFARKLGLAFQVQDDILDLIGDEQLIGKPVQSDVEQKKVTYPFLIGLEQSKALVERLTAEAKQHVVQANLAQPERLLQIADYLMSRNH